jgi:hypothetical protein
MEGLPCLFDGAGGGDLVSLTQQCQFIQGTQVWLVIDDQNVYVA